MQRLQKLLLAVIILAALIVLFPGQIALAGGGKSTRAYQTYAVKSGDTLAHIARRFHTSPRAIRRINHLRSARLHPGQRLKIPLRKPVADGSCDVAYRVRRGDTLHAIARRCGVTQNQLLAINHLDGAQRLRVGRWLRIPAKNGGRQHAYLPVPGR